MPTPTNEDIIRSIQSQYPLLQAKAREEQARAEKKALLDASMRAAKVNAAISRIPVLGSASWGGQFFRGLGQNINDALHHGPPMFKSAGKAMADDLGKGLPAMGEEINSPFDFAMSESAYKSPHWKDFRHHYDKAYGDNLAVAIAELANPVSLAVAPIRAANIAKRGKEFQAAYRRARRKYKPTDPVEKQQLANQEIAEAISKDAAKKQGKYGGDYLYKASDSDYGGPGATYAVKAEDASTGYLYNRSVSFKEGGRGGHHWWRVRLPKDARILDLTAYEDLNPFIVEQMKSGKMEYKITSEYWWKKLKDQGIQPPQGSAAGGFIRNEHVYPFSAIENPRIRKQLVDRGWTHVRYLDTNPRNAEVLQRIAPGRDEVVRIDEKKIIGQRDTIGSRDFSDVDLKNAWFKGSNYEASQFYKADLRGADFNGKSFIDSNFAGADLRGSNWQGANFSGSFVRGAKLPKGFEDVWEVEDGIVSLKRGPEKEFIHEFAKWQKERKQSLVKRDPVERIETEVMSGTPRPKRANPALKPGYPVGGINDDLHIEEFAEWAKTQDDVTLARHFKNEQFTVEDAWKKAKSGESISEYRKRAFKKSKERSEFIEQRLRATKLPSNEEIEKGVAGTVDYYSNLFDEAKSGFDSHMESVGYRRVGGAYTEKQLEAAEDFKKRLAEWDNTDLSGFYVLSPDLVKAMKGFDLSDHVKRSLAVIDTDSLKIGFEFGDGNFFKYKQVMLANDESPAQIKRAIEEFRSVESRLVNQFSQQKHGYDKFADRWYISQIRQAIKILETGLDRRLLK